MSEPRTWILSEHNDGAWRVSEDASHSTLSIDERVPVVELSVLEAERAARDSAEAKAEKAEREREAARKAIRNGLKEVAMYRNIAVPALGQRDRLAVALREARGEAYAIATGDPAEEHIVEYQDTAREIARKATAALSVLDRETPGE